MNIEKLCIAFVGIDGFIPHFCAEESSSLQPQMLALSALGTGLHESVYPLHDLSHLVPCQHSPDMMERNSIILGF